MTDLLERAVARASALPPDRQNQIGTRILEEIEADSQWDELFGSKPQVLADIEAEARQAWSAGDYAPLNFDRRP
jgi:hypothetical protein